MLSDTSITQRQGAARRLPVEHLTSRSGLDGRLSVGVREAARLLGVHHSTIERAIRRGALPSSKLGARVLIPVEALRQILTDAETR